MPFRDPRGGDLATRIETEIRERLEEAIDAACLDTLVRVRQAKQLPPPQADSAQDRAEYHAEVRRLLERLDAQLAGLIDEPIPPVRDRERTDLRERQRADAGDGQHADPQDGTAGEGGSASRLMSTQIALARALPDYWQRFDAVRLEYAAERAASGGESRGFLHRLFGRG